MPNSSVPPNLGQKDARGHVPPIRQYVGKVKAVHQDEAHVTVADGPGSMVVPLLPGSRVPRVGDAVMVLGDRTGGMALVLRNHLIYWNYAALLPYTPPDKLTGPPCKIVAWSLEADVAGTLALDIRLGDRSGLSICGGTPPALGGTISNGDIVLPDSGWQRYLGLQGQDVPLYFVVEDDPAPTVTKYNVCLFAEVR